MRYVSWCIYVLFFLIPLQTVYLFSTPTIGTPPGIWQYGVIGLYAIDIIAAVVLVYAAWGLIRKKDIRILIAARFEHTPFLCMTVGWLLLLLWSLAALIWAPALWSSVYGVTRLAEIGLLVGALHILKWSWVNAAVAYVSMAAIQGVLAWQQFLSNRIDANKWLGFSYHSSLELGDSVVESVLRRFLRAYGMFAHPNMFGIYLAIAIVLCLALLWYVKYKWQGYLLVIAWISIGSGLLLSFSRAAWIATIVGSVCTLISLYYFRRHVHEGVDRYEGFGVMLIAVTIIMIGVLGYATWEPLSTRLGIGGITRLESKSIMERGASLKEGVALVYSALPWGVGLGQYTYAIFLNDEKQGHAKPSYDYQPAHAVPLLIASELGVGGIMGSLLFLFGYILLLIRRARTVDSFYNAVHVSLSFSLLIVLLVASLSDHFLWTTHAGSMIMVVVLSITFAPFFQRPSLALQTGHNRQNNRTGV